MAAPQDLRYTKTHEWVRQDGETATIGISDYAQTELGDIVCGWLLLRGAEVALEKLAGDVSAKDKAFYEGKVAAAQFFARTQLPTLTAERHVAEAVDLAIMDLDEAAF